MPGPRQSEFGGLLLQSQSSPKSAPAYGSPARQYGSAAAGDRQRTSARLRNQSVAISAYKPVSILVQLLHYREQKSSLPGAMHRPIHAHIFKRIAYLYFKIGSLRQNFDLWRTGTLNLPVTGRKFSSNYLDAVETIFRTMSGKLSGRLHVFSSLAICSGPAEPDVATLACCQADLFLWRR